MKTERKPYPSDVTDAEWEFLLSYMILMREDTPQREFPLRELFNALRYVAKTGCRRRFLPHDFPLWTAVHQQARRSLHAGVFEQITHDLRVVTRFPAGRNDQPSGVIFDGRTIQSTPQSGKRAGYDGGKNEERVQNTYCRLCIRNRSALKVTSADEQERAQVSELAALVQEVTGKTVQIAYVDQGYTGENPAKDAETHGIKFEVVKHTEAKKGFVLLPRRWVVERSFGWLGRFRRLARDYERLTETLAGWHWVAFLSLLLPKIIPISG